MLLYSLIYKTQSVHSLWCYVRLFYERRDSLNSRWTLSCTHYLKIFTLISHSELVFNHSLQLDRNSKVGILFRKVRVCERYIHYLIGMYSLRPSIETKKMNNCFIFDNVFKSHNVFKHHSKWCCPINGKYSKSYAEQVNKIH